MITELSNLTTLTPSEFIRSLRESFTGAKVVYTNGSCYQLYLILKGLYPKAVAYYDDYSSHVYTRIGDKYYDIYGECTNPITLLIIKPLVDIPKVHEAAPSWIWSLDKEIRE
jgi:hypothetical protein